MLAGQVGHWGVNPKVSAVLGVGREEPPRSRSARSEEGDQNNAYETTHHERALQGSVRLLEARMSDRRAEQQTSACRWRSRISVESRVPQSPANGEPR